VDQHNARLPLGVRLIRAVPGQLRVEFERRASSEVPVQVRFSGPPPHGFHMQRHQVDPVRLTILGPQSRVRQVEFAETDPVEVPAKAGETEIRVNAFVREPQVRFATPPLVRVKVVLEATGTERR